MARLWILIGCCLAMIACDKKTPPSPPIVETPSGPETINGSERLGWDQPASDTAELATIGYAVYLDGVRTVLSGVTCASAAAAAGFPCSARLPTISAGSHVLELASFVTDGGLLESARSAALRVTVTAQSASSPAISPMLRRSLAWSETATIDGLDSPSDIAFAPDGRLFIAERTAIRIVPPPPSATARQVPPLASTRQVAPAPIAEPAITLADTVGTEGRILAIALDPRFAQTRHLFAIYTVPGRSGELTFTLSRFREVSDTLGDEAVLLDRVPAASPSPAATLRFGPDGQLYVAFDDGGDARRRGDLASLNGKVLRLNPDGTTPAAANGTPVFAAGLGSPVAIDWDPQTSTLWVADRASNGSRFMFYRGGMQPAWAGRMLTADLLFERGSEADVSFVAVAPDGAIYFGRAGALGRLAPDRGP